MVCNLSRLDEAKIAAIRTMEKKIGKTLLAFSCHDISPADLSAEEINQIHEMEKKLGLVLVAVKA